MYTDAYTYVHLFSRVHTRARVLAVSYRLCIDVRFPVFIWQPMQVAAAVMQADRQTDREADIQIEVLREREKTESGLG